MEKDFDAWNKVKKLTNAEQPRLYTVREIWWCRIGVNIGTEQDGKVLFPEYEKPPKTCFDGFSHYLPLAGARPKPTVLWIIQLST